MGPRKLQLMLTTFVAVGSAIKQWDADGFFATAYAQSGRTEMGGGRRVGAGAETVPLCASRKSTLRDRHGRRVLTERPVCRRPRRAITAHITERSRVTAGYGLAHESAAVAGANPALRGYCRYSTHSTPVQACAGPAMSNSLVKPSTR